jgi:hypothetical protein
MVAALCSILLAAKKHAGFTAVLVLLLALPRTAGQGTGYSSPSVDMTNSKATNLAVRWPKGRFLAFSNSAVVPPVMAVGNTSVQVGNCCVRGLSPTDGNRKLVAMQLGVPVGLVDRILARSAQDQELKDAALAQELRAATIEFRFLLAEMTSYSPPAERQQAKADALQALLAGDLPKAWDTYVQLPWPSPPAPPSGLRIIAGAP